VWPSARELLAPRGPWLVPLLVMLAARVLLWRQIPYAAEDAYITFRYAKHLAAGHGLVYNPGERVFGFSSPLWTLWNGLGHLLGANPVIWTRLTTLATDAVVLILVAALLRRHASVAAAWCFAGFFALWPYVAAVGLSGMENSTLLALIVVAAVLAERGHALAGPALAAVALMRPEGIAAAAVLMLGARWRDRLVALALVVLGVGALALYFGSPLPQSVAAKSQLYGTPGPWAGRFWWEWLLPSLLGRFPVMTEGLHVFLMSVVFTPALVAGARSLWPARGSALGLAIAACLVVWLGYALLGVAYFWWYLIVPLGGLVAVAAVGLPRIVRGPGIYVALVALMAGLWTLAVHLYIGRAQNEFYGFGATANYLVRNGRAGDQVMLEPIGMVGYTVPMTVVDEVGLVTPEVARRRLAGPGWYTDVVAARRPEWLVVRRGVLRGGQAFAGAGAPFRSAAERDAMLERYTIATVIDTTSGDQSLIVLRRRE